MADSGSKKRASGPKLGGQSLQKLLDTQLAKHKVVGATLGILKDGVIHTAASGSLNLDTGVDCTPDSIFQIGSIGKVFTATLVMQLVDEGRVTLDEPIRTYLPEFQVADDTATKTITLRHLLTHTSGLDGDFFPDDDPDGPSVRSYIAKIRLMPSLYPPGDGPVTYCNAAFVIAGRVIEVMTGQTWQTAVMERICKPLGMPQAFAHPHEALRYRCAMGHMRDHDDPEKIVTAKETFLMGSAAPAGSVLSMSVESLLMFARAHLNGGKYGDDKRLLSEQSARAMRENGIAHLPIGPDNYMYAGLGWGLGRFPKHNMMGHGGGTFGHYSYLQAYPDKGIAWSMLTNSDSAPMSLEIGKLVVTELVGGAPPPDPKIPEFTVNNGRCAGHYTSLGGDFFVTDEDGTLRVKMVDSMKIDPDMTGTLKPWAEDVFDFKLDRPGMLDGQKLQFVGDAGDGRARFLRCFGRMSRRVGG